MADAELCRQIMCGAVSQAEAGPEALWECSQAGYVGVLPCSHPDCQPYLAMMQARGVCPMPEPERVIEILPLHPPVQPDVGEAPLPPVERIVPADVVAPLPSIVTRPSSPALERDYYCEFMRWVAANQWLAAAVVAAGWWFLSRDKGGR